MKSIKFCKSIIKKLPKCTILKKLPTADEVKELSIRTYSKSWRNKSNIIRKSIKKDCLLLSVPYRERANSLGTTTKLSPTIRNTTMKKTKEVTPHNSYWKTTNEDTPTHHTTPHQMKEYGMALWQQTTKIT
jgi:hypothetical protein